MHGGDVHEGFPGDEGRTTGEEEVEGLAAELSLGVGFLIEGDSADAINDILQMRRDGEVPDGGGNHDAIRCQYFLLEETEVIIGLTGLRVALECEVLDLEMPENDRVQRDIRDTLTPFCEGCRKSCAITGVIGAGNNAEDTRFHDYECTDAVGDVSW